MNMLVTALHEAGVLEARAGREGGGQLVSSVVATPTDPAAAIWSAILARSGSRLLEEDAWADLLLVEGDPTQDITVLRDHEKNLAVIIRTKVRKNARLPLPGAS